MTDLPAGLYDQLITEELQKRFEPLDSALLDRCRLDPADAPEVLARHIGHLAKLRLLAIKGDDDENLAAQIGAANAIARFITAAPPDELVLGELVAEPGELLHAVATSAPLPGQPAFPPRPDIPLGASALLVNGRDQPRIGAEVQKELMSADRVDLLCAFIKWHGLRILDRHLENLVRRGGRLRVITTTYMGASDQRAIDRLVELGAELKVSYETRMTRLHAKAWLFHRDTGFSTAYVGSSNLSKSALLDGLEWNVRLSAVEHGHLLDTFSGTFDDYWEDSEFESYDPSDLKQSKRLSTALEKESTGPRELPLEITSLDVQPWGYQREILDRLMAERRVHQRWHSLVVMATGTGKTIVAGLDYRRLRRENIVDSVLFVAHREEILSQSLGAFRQILQSGSFGERFVAGDKPADWRHVFASVQSMAQVDIARDLDPARFDMVIVDEFHHSAGETYARLLRHLKPKLLLGLTATPERSDGIDVRQWFGGRTAIELRLWEALEQNLLAPFQYFGLHDGTDLHSLRWKRGSGYDPSELTKLYTGHDARNGIIAKAILDKVGVPEAMRAVAFCVSIEHADFMARWFMHRGFRALSVTSKTARDVRREAIQDLRDRRVNVLFTVDLFNEGVDIPEIDTILFLRPTESATIFLQQLGRGLRLCEGKDCLTVLDFVGNQHAEFRLDLRFRAITGATRRNLVRQIEADFPTLPAGCHIELDPVAKRIVLDNIRGALAVRWPSLVAELRAIGDCSLQTFLEETGLEIQDLYRTFRGGWTDLRRSAGFEPADPGADDAVIGRAIGRMLHIDDVERIQFIRGLLSGSPSNPTGTGSDRDKRLLHMVHFLLWGWNTPRDEASDRLLALRTNMPRVRELIDVLKVLENGITRVNEPLGPGPIPLHIHARYTLAELLAAFDVPNPASARGTGVRRVEAERAHVFWFNIRKTERHFSPSTMYADRAISPTLFQWESQSTTRSASPTGQAYINHVARKESIHLFFRESKESEGALGAPPYIYAGPATYVSHRGDRPMRIIWKLDHPLPDDVFQSARVATG